MSNSNLIYLQLSEWCSVSPIMSHAECGRSSFAHLTATRQPPTTTLATHISTPLLTKANPLHPSFSTASPILNHVTHIPEYLQHTKPLGERVKATQPPLRSSPLAIVAR
jgi:hypothetical protein